LSEPHVYKGHCHCGAINFTLRSPIPASKLQVRACQCGFCTRHGAMTVSDPSGYAVFDIARDRLATYQFATRTGVILICGNCGVYAGVTVEADGRTWSVVNVRGLAIHEFQGRIPEPVFYDGETREMRIRRRQMNWTPTEIRINENAGDYIAVLNRDN
jgi:hypothetical protein